MTCSIASGQYISRRERYGEVIWAGFFLWTLGAALTCIFSRSTPIVAMVFILGCQGAGVGFVFQPTLVALQAHCTKAQRAVVISNRNFLRSTGGAIGLAISAVLLQNRLEHNLPAEYEYLALSSYSTPDFSTISETQKNVILNAYASASRSVFILNVPFITLCLVGCIFVKDRGLKRPDEVGIQAGDEERKEQMLDIEIGRTPAGEESQDDLLVQSVEGKVENKIESDRASR